MKDPKIKSRIKKIYGLLDGYFGDLGWWPARSRFEVIVGAVLTQNTSWTNVEKAIECLRKKRLLNFHSLKNADNRVISEAIRSSGYYVQKTEKLKNVCAFLDDLCGGDLRKALLEDTDHLRQKLLEVKGIGPETADSILLYAFKKPVFVVDAYTLRIFERHGILEGRGSKYEDVRDLVHSVFGENEPLYNRFHAAIVETGKGFCIKRQPKCKECPLRPLLTVAPKKKGKNNGTAFNYVRSCRTGRKGGR